MDETAKNREGVDSSGSKQTSGILTMPTGPTKTMAVIVAHGAGMT